MGYVGIATVVLIPLGIIGEIQAGKAAAATQFAKALNCPRVYVYDGNQYRFKSGVFSGAVYSSIEQADYLPLEGLNDYNGKYRFRLMNNQDEEQYINQVQVIRVAHDPSTRVLIDRKGMVHSYSSPVAPVKTSLINDSTGITLGSRDSVAFLFNQKADTTSAFASVVLTFDKPAGAKQAKLVINAKNSMWAGYLSDEFSSMFGDKLQEIYRERR